MNYFAPKRGLLSMHCSATADRQDRPSSLLFGLSGTGKTTLSADPKRDLIGDDEHCWSDDGIFNIEGGCYAKAIDLSPETEPDIFQALRFGACWRTWCSTTITRGFHRHEHHGEHARAPIRSSSSRNAKIPCMAGHPTDVIFLTCDAFGVLPPVSSLSPAQAMYHFISGYTAKVAGTEVGVTEPQATFSPCFGGPFLVWHPTKYAELLADENAPAQRARLAGQHRLERRRLRRRQADQARQHPRHHRRDPRRRRWRTPRPSATRCSASTWSPACPGVPSEILWPRNTWADKAAYDAAAKKLAGLFINNFKTYAADASAEVKAAAPVA